MCGGMGLGWFCQGVLQRNGKFAMEGCVGRKPAEYGRGFKKWSLHSASRGSIVRWASFFAGCGARLTWRRQLDAVLQPK